MQIRNPRHEPELTSTCLTVLGIPLNFQYAVYAPHYVEWSLDPDDRGKNALLEILLRIHYNEYIEAQLREDWFRREYEDNQFRMPTSLDDIPF